VKHYSIRTEQAYVDWIRRFILFTTNDIQMKWRTGDHAIPDPPGSAKECCCIVVHRRSKKPPPLLIEVQSPQK
jgi:hypothetical protein